MKQYIYFKEIPIGAEFSCNGNKCIKKSTRTALLTEYNKTFYFSMKQLCIVGVHRRLAPDYFDRKK